MTDRCPRLPKDLRELVESVDHEYVRGTKHWKIYINGKLAAVWPHGRAAADMSQGTTHWASQIRRAIRGEYAR